MRHGQVRIKSGRPASTIEVIYHALIDETVSSFGRWLTEYELGLITGLSPGSVKSCLYRLRRDQLVKFRRRAKDPHHRAAMAMEYALLGSDL